MNKGKIAKVHQLLLVFFISFLYNKMNLTLTGLSSSRVAHFLVENQETGNERPGNFLQEIALFLENFLVVTKMDYNVVKIDQIFSSESKPTFLYHLKSFSHLQK